MRLLVASGMPAGFAAKAVDDVQHARRQQVGNQLGQDEDGDGGFSAGLSTTQFSGAQRRGQLCVAIRMGSSTGMIWPTTPSGSWMWYATVFSSRFDREPSCARTQPAK